MPHHMTTTEITTITGICDSFPPRSEAIVRCFCVVWWRARVSRWHRCLLADGSAQSKEESQTTCGFVMLAMWSSMRDAATWLVLVVDHACKILKLHVGTRGR